MSRKCLWYQVPIVCATLAFLSGGPSAPAQLAEAESEDVLAEDPNQLIDIFFLRGLGGTARPIPESRVVGRGEVYLGFEDDCYHKRHCLKLLGGDFLVSCSIADAKAAGCLPCKLCNPSTEGIAKPSVSVVAPPPKEEAGKKPKKAKKETLEGVTVIEFKPTPVYEDPLLKVLLEQRRLAVQAERRQKRAAASRRASPEDVPGEESSSDDHEAPSPKTGKPKPEWVEAYYTMDGTYIPGHWRSR